MNIGNPIQGLCHSRRGQCVTTRDGPSYLHCNASELMWNLSCGICLAFDNPDTLVGRHQDLLFLSLLFWCYPCPRCRFFKGFLFCIGCFTCDDAPLRPNLSHCFLVFWPSCGSCGITDLCGCSHASWMSQCSHVFWLTCGSCGMRN